jgi:predicted HicB family RNase H-like nuclease
MQKKKRKQIAFDIDPELHKRIKADAALKGISINLWMAMAIYQKFKRPSS